MASSSRTKRNNEGGAAAAAPLHPMPISAMLSSAHDLDVPLTANDKNLVEEFEARWSEFIQDNPDMMPSGGRSKRINDLHQEVVTARKSQRDVEKELEQQLLLFGRTRDLLESNYRKGMQEANQKQASIRNTLQNELDNAIAADRLESQLVPWQHFLNSVDRASLVPTMDVTKGKKVVKPSARAMALVDPSGDPSDVQLRAYRIDHALLTAQVEMLQKEIIRCEKTTDGLELVGNFLTENNIWALLSKTH